MARYRSKFTGRFLSSKQSIAEGQVGEIKGLKELLRKFDKFEKITARKAEVGMKKAVAYLLRESQKIVPVDTGALKASGHVVVQGSGFDTRAFVVYSTGYAIFVHEDLNARHKKGKYAKYVERPLREKNKQILAIIAKELKRR